MHSKFLKATGLSATVAAVAAVAVPASSAAPRATVSGAISFYAVSQNNHKPVDLVAGAIADHGTDHGVGNTSYEEIVLSKGTFQVQSAKLNKSFKFKVDPATCEASLHGAATNLPVLKGTGAYAGITGTISVKAVEVGFLPRTKAGKCNANADPSPSDFILEGTGHVSY